MQYNIHAVYKRTGTVPVSWFGSQLTQDVEYTDDSKSTSRYMRNDPI